MNVPNLQIALDQNTLEDALGIVKQAGPAVDVVEAGTILQLQVGNVAIKCLRKMFPDKIVVSDTKCADAGGTVARNSREAGADWMTVICAATIPTMKSAKKELSDLQVELYGDWTWEQAKAWRKAGIDQAVYHQSRDALLAGEVWGPKDLKVVKQLIDLGFKVSVTGGLNVDTIKLFKGVPVFTFIAGRAITGADDPYIAAKKLKDEIKKYWN
ncbi:3-keto-L-gulonate-6-phosphate decarboxylase [Loigolactobacillus coryniformis subsp. coryniformis]|uniref:3-hexulose-6-phosphate synthase n=1 Tax=Loigolactobacillus coryniformis subsp. coryniformis KCTC 3167 = DSM 20001 TaxID=913848 RepID=A0A0R1F5A8_9LACO|nr:3-keto-L-gulonate-6-phosphate decarboxylase UlaD [Loigolactobacillus coryniformis]ATO56324.1 3-keto-L-gulonate-6-phosphate decarboxylase [Loigolactobacillus coryniformis subsp. coryniformis KCTC 3167 = DSM 20001]KRK14250.1 3-keto-L-gulonate-6-phosphate decarboxylase [Loigolactobacillus coryniformis subsp. coryniformis KCTC 3167 = DSM 20001]OEH90994.1 3-keto-L-gulonate-6-phosphate decarboxylase [Loigolactobacillus coryniformis subsp. coryniformis]